MSLRSKPGRAVVIALANVAVLVVLLLTAELVARGYAVAFKGKTFFRPPVDSPWISSYEQPFPKFVEGGGIFQQNDRVVPHEKQDGEYRIIAVGGSTTVGRDAYRMAGYDYPTRLEQRLNELDLQREFVVMNAGGDAYSTLHSLINIQSRLLEYRPDMIIMMEGVNDYSVAYFGEDVLPDYGNKYLEPYFVHPQLQATSSVFGALSQSRLLAATPLLHHITDAVGSYDRRRSVEPVIRLFERNLASIHAILEKHGVELLVVSQPHMRSEGQKDAQDAARVASSARDYCRANGVTFVDLFEEFGQNPRHFVDLVHHTPAGIDHFVDLILPHVAKAAQRSWVES